MTDPSELGKEEKGCEVEIESHSADSMGHSLGLLGKSFYLSDLHILNL